MDQSQSEPQKVSFIKKWGTLIILSLALAIIVIDTTILNVSLAKIIQDLHTDIQKIQWVITAYSLMLAAFTITGGRLGDLFGRKRMFMLGAIIFAIGSFTASISTSVGMLIWGEAIIEGIGAALMLPATSSLLVSNYKGRDRAIAFGVWGGIAGASAALGPILGGFLTTYYSWRWAFRINVGIAILLLIGSIVIAESRDEHKMSIDWLGIIFSAVGLFFVAFGIIESSNYGWWIAKQTFKIGTLALNLSWNLSISIFSIIWGLIFLLFFILWELHQERKGKTPLITMSIFSNRQFSSGAITTGILSLGLTGITFIMPVFYQAVRGLDAFQTGFGLLPMSLCLLIMAPVSALLIKKIPVKTVVLLGLTLNVAAYIVLAITITPDSTIWTLTPGLVLFGAGIGLVMAQVSNITLSAVSVEQAGEASGINNTLRQVGSTLGAAILGTILISSVSTNLTKNIQASTVIPDQSKSSLEQTVSSQVSNVEFGGGASLDGAVPQGIKNEIITISHKSITDGSRKSLLFGIIFAVLSFIAALFLPQKITEHGLSEEGAVPMGH